jgi:hypothetical protein
MREPFPGGPVSLDCTADGCADPAIRWAFSADPLQWHVDALEAELADALDLADQAREVAARALELLTGVHERVEV